ncbi:MULTISPECIES: protein kinase [unclassified Streptomyces]|uniref:serine/threonine-protein kinase n=1 Tax=unclassified Streptomyces TaxID=2593676 RepID=UPI0038251808
MQPLEAGEPRTIGAYRLLGRLGAGGMGRVYLGRSAGGRTVAVKVVHPHFALDEQFRARFRHEVEAARRVGGAWTAPVLDADPQAPVPWVATGYVAGPSLTQAVTGHGPLPAHSVRVLGAGLAEALAAVHALGLVHRDVKPSNVLLTLDGPRLIDFGIARATDGTASLTATGVSIGSPGYMSPEQILGRGASVTGAADVFSLGAVLAYAATGEPPFPGDSSAALLYKVVHEQPELGAALGGELREVVEACLAKAPADRPSPGALSSRLAPAGAAALVRSGWLPSPLVEEVSRSAVRLLDLEPEETAWGSGPIPFSSPAVEGAEDAVRGWGPTPHSGPAVGEFGPPDASYGGVDSAFPGPRTPALPAGPADAAYGSAGPESSAALIPPRPTGPPGPADRGPRVALSVATAAEPGERGRGRKVSCTVALAVAGALAAVTFGAAFLFDLLPGGNANNTGAKPPASSPATDSAQPPASASPSGSPSEGGQLADVPSEFIGTWKGVLTQDNGTSGYAYTAVITKGAKGADVVRTTTTIGPLECHGIGALDSATARVLHITERTDPTKPSTIGCTGATAAMTYTLQSDGKLRFESQETAAGRPTGTLARQGG